VYAVQLLIREGEFHGKEITDITGNEHALDFSPDHVPSCHPFSFSISAPFFCSQFPQFDI
jgi:hypothetical protein